MHGPPTKPYASFKEDHNADRKYGTKNGTNDLPLFPFFLGVAPVMCATLSSDMKLPAIPIVVPMKDAIMRTAIIPTLPVMPASC